MPTDWIDERTLDADWYGRPRPRNPDSSVAAQYEDSVLPEPEGDEAYEPS